MSKTILIIDDDIMMLKLLSHPISKEGYNVVTMQDSRKAVELLEKEDVDLIITDMHMPFITGIEIIDIVRNELEKKYPIIVLTKDVTNETEENSYLIGATEFFQKPVNIKILVLKINRMLANK